MFTANIHIYTYFYSINIYIYVHMYAHFWNFAFAHTYLSFLPFSVASEAPDDDRIAAPSQAKAEARRLECHSLCFSILSQVFV